jgi:hypothetical protein
VLAHERPFALAEHAWLGEDRLGDRHLADVVQLGGDPHALDERGAAAQLARDLLDKAHDVVEVVGSVSTAEAARSRTPWSPPGSSAQNSSPPIR